jgi:hypothetical protein
MWGLTGWCSSGGVLTDKQHSGIEVGLQEFHRRDRV